MPVVVLGPDDSVYSKVVSNVEEVKARGGKVIAVVSEGDSQLAEKVDHVITVPQTLDIYPAADPHGGPPPAAGL